MGWLKGLLETIKTTPKLFVVFLRTREMPKKWPFDQGDAYMDRSLREIRSEFNIRLID